MIYPPYKNAKLSDVSQGFSFVHQAIDFAPSSGYGTFLVAPERVIVERIVTKTSMADNFDELKRGYGIKMKSVSNSYRHYLYWHCLPVFPVDEGDLVEAGAIVAEMGNSGLVYSNGVYVELADRTTTHKGTHLHLECYDIVNGTAVYSDVLKIINFSQDINLGIVKATSQIFTKMINLIKGRK